MLSRDKHTSDTIEQWKVIKEFPRYSISNLGRVKSKVGKKEIILIPNIIKGYEYVKLYKLNNNSMSNLKLLRVHRIVAQYFCENFSEDKEVHHLDKNTRNNKASNLICLTKAEHIELHKKLNMLNSQTEDNKGGV